VRAARWRRHGAAWLAVAACLAGCAGGAARNEGAAKAERVILLAGTGLDAKMLALVRGAAARDGNALAIDRLPARAAIMPAADRSAAMSALMRGAIACGPDGAKPSSLLERARSAGRAAGIVTTARLTGLVPASAYAPGCAAPGENAAAAMLVPGGPGASPALGADGLDLALGGGRLFFLPPALGGERGDGRRLIDELGAKGYRIIENIAGFRALDAAPPRRVIGIFAWDHVSDEADRDGAAEPSLAQMSGKAIELLSRHRRGYFLLIESGQIGALLQEGDRSRAAIEAIALDDTLRTAIATAQGADPGLAHTLVVLVGDDFAAAIGTDAGAIARARDWSDVHRVIDGAMGRP
jgi:alkaline phosphatase